MARSGEVLARIRRGGADDGRWQEYRLAYRHDQTVLDLVTEIQRRHDPSLAYRFACRVGMCGSCAMTVNGRPRWTCRTHVATVAGRGALEIGPLWNLPVIRDLAVDMTPFFERWQRAEARFEGRATRDNHPAAVSPESSARREADLAIGDWEDDDYDAPSGDYTGITEADRESADAVALAAHLVAGALHLGVGLRRLDLVVFVTPDGERACERGPRPELTCSTHGFSPSQHYVDPSVSPGRAL